MEKARPSKKQRELLNYIEGFIATSGYGPSYREIMRALGYKSVSTVAIHVNGLIANGLLEKKDRSPRSLAIPTKADPVKEREHHIAWLQTEISRRESIGGAQVEQEIAVLRRALTILSP